MKYFGNPLGRGGRIGYGALSAIKGTVMLSDYSNYAAAFHNPAYWPLIAVDLTLEADVILTACTDRTLPITTTIIGSLPFGQKLLGKIENIYDFMLYGNSGVSLSDKTERI